VHLTIVPYPCRNDKVPYLLLFKEKFTVSGGGDGEKCHRQVQYWLVQ